MDDFEIDLQGNGENETNSVQLPMNSLTFGDIENDDVKVYIKQDVYKALEKYALADTTQERGTIILGDYCEEFGKKHVIISNYIEAKYTEASASTLTFTHETWDYVHKKQDELYPDKKIVGWQHTHPNYGVFLSNYDLFIHENFFNLPFQVAYVIDPIQNIRGFFQWKNGKIEKLKGFYIYDDIEKPIKIEQTKSEAKQSESSKKLSARVKDFLALLTVLTVGLLICTGILYIKQSKSQQGLANQIAEQNKTIQQQAADITSLQEQLLNIVVDDSGKTNAMYLLEKLENQEIVLKNQGEVINELKELIKKSDKEGNEVKYIMHKVQSGESLTKICNEYGVNYNASKNIILSLNGISNPNVIYVGQNIILPVINNSDQ